VQWMSAMPTVSACRIKNAVFTTPQLNSRVITRGEPCSSITVHQYGTVLYSTVYCTGRDLQPTCGHRDANSLTKVLTGHRLQH
jgi:hypothetical protein